MRNKKNQANIDNSNLLYYPDGRIKNNTGGNNGTPVNEEVYGDIHEAMNRLMRLAGINYNNLPDNAFNGYQLVDAMIHLASKNDFIINLTGDFSTSTYIDGNGIEIVDEIPVNRLKVNIKLAKLIANESFILKAFVNKGAQTTIRGIDNVVKSVSFQGDFESGEYVRMIVRTTDILLVRMVDFSNIAVIGTTLNVSPTATDAEDLAGTSDEVSSTPLGAKNAFIKKVTGDESGDYIASATNNGLMSSELWQKLEDFIEPTSLISITSGIDTVTNYANGYKENDFNSNYFDIIPPAGKVMADLQSVTVSIAELKIDKTDVVDSRSWCKYEIQASKIRMIAGASEASESAKISWQAIWI